jgi:predicted nuclease of predicted toxin-antitoxin system
MKFLLDVCVSSHSLQASLVSLGHDVLSAAAIDPKASDERLMALALQDERVLVTEDRDFGELIFVRKLPHGPIVRLVELSVNEQVQGMAELLERRAAELAGAVIITVTRGRIRIRRQGQDPR